MAVSIDWDTGVITVPKADMTLISSSPYEVRELDVNDFRLEILGLEGSEEGMPFLKTHTHSTEVTLSGIAYARIVSFINGYTITFEDGNYAVSLTGANNNISDVMNLNNVSLRSSNSAGLVNPRIAEQIWDAPINDHSTTGTFGTLLKNIYNLILILLGR